MVLDTSVSRQTYIEDCEVCCRPIEVTYVVEDGELVEFGAKGVELGRPVNEKKRAKEKKGSLNAEAQRVLRIRRGGGEVRRSWKWFDGVVEAPGPGEKGKRGSSPAAAGSE
jgi:hypothetical protein